LRKLTARIITKPRGKARARVKVKHVSAKEQNGRQQKCCTRDLERGREAESLRQGRHERRRDSRWEGGRQESCEGTAKGRARRRANRKEGEREGGGR
jgi:hypothetical protein